METPTDATVRATISLPAWLADKAKAHDVSLSRFVQQTLPKHIREKEEADWLARNRQGIEELNEFTRKYGVLSETLRTF